MYIVVLTHLCFLQGFRVDINCKQLTVDFVNQSVLQIGGQESKRSDTTDFAEKLGAMNRRWQILQTRTTERVRNQKSLIKFKIVFIYNLPRIRMLNVQYYHK